MKTSKQAARAPSKQRKPVTVDRWQGGWIVRVGLGGREVYYVRDRQPQQGRAS